MWIQGAHVYIFSLRKSGLAKTQPARSLATTMLSSIICSVSSIAIQTLYCKWQVGGHLHGKGWIIQAPLGAIANPQFLLLELQAPVVTCLGQYSMNQLENERYHLLPEKGEDVEIIRSTIVYLLCSSCEH